MQNSEIGKNETETSDIYLKVVRYMINRRGSSDAKKTTRYRAAKQNASIRCREHIIGTATYTVSQKKRQ